MKTIEKRKGVLYFSDNVLEKGIDHMVVSDGARVLEIEFTGFGDNAVITRLALNGVESPTITSKRLISLEYCYHYNPVLKTDKWSVQSPASSGKHVNWLHRCGGISWEEFLDVIEERMSLDELMDYKAAEECARVTDFAGKARHALENISVINSQGGPGSRNAVRDIINAILK